MAIAPHTPLTWSKGDSDTFVVGADGFNLLKSREFDQFTYCAVGLGGTKGEEKPVPREFVTQAFFPGTTIELIAQEDTAPFEVQF